ncbi:MAG: hypothetical protein D3906_02190 [Candidatus Electrothrix sp. AUS1_2]|nr:hypothetical protein [Candidatus Electrothrix sp. AUS1_2]
MIVAVLSLVVAITIPELRSFFGLEKETVSPPPEVTRPIEQTSHPEPEIKQESPEIPERPEVPTHRGPVRYTVHENQSRFVEAAQTSLSVAFHDVLGEEVASLTIAPDGKNSSPHAVLDGYTQELTSSAGTFLVQILRVDYEGRKVEMQVTEK